MIEFQKKIKKNIIKEAKKDGLDISLDDFDDFSENIKKLESDILKIEHEDLRLFSLEVYMMCLKLFVSWKRNDESLIKDSLGNFLDIGKSLYDQYFISED